MVDDFPGAVLDTWNLSKIYKLPQKILRLLLENHLSQLREFFPCLEKLTTYISVIASEIT
jgi:hypothetical protein